VAIAWLLVFLLGGAPGVYDASGAPALVLTGDDAAVAAVRGALTNRNVPIAPAPRVLAARIEPTPGGLALTIRDAAGRTALHQVASPALAAALIESWMRPDFTGPLLAARAMPPLDEAEAEAEAEPTVVAAPPVPPIAPPADPIDFTLMGETGLASDRSLWAGASAATRMRWGGFRLGPRVRFAAQAVASDARRAVYKDDRDADLRHLGAELLLALDRPFALGPLWLTPGLGLGAAWSRARAVHEERTTVADSFAPRAEADLTLTIPLWRRLGLDVGLGFAVTPALRHFTEQDDFTIPAAPAGQLRGGLGLRYGRP